MATEQPRVGDRLQIPVGDTQMWATVLKVIPYSTGQGEGWLVTHDIDDMGVYDNFVLNDPNHGEYRVNRSRMPYRDYAKSFQWELYGTDTSKAQKLANAFVLNFNRFADNGFGLYICSEVNGSGKTYLACCLGMEIAKRYSTVIKFCTVNDYISMLRDKDPETTAIRSARLLILDDVGAQSEKQEWISDALFHLIDERVKSKMSTIYTSNMEIKQSSKNDRTSARINASSHVLKLPEVSIRDIKAQELKTEFLNRLSA